MSQDAVSVTAEGFVPRFPTTTDDTAVDHIEAHRSASPSAVVLSDAPTVADSVPEAETAQAVSDSVSGAAPDEEDSSAAVLTAQEEVAPAPITINAVGDGKRERTASVSDEKDENEQQQQDGCQDPTGDTVREEELAPGQSPATRPRLEESVTEDDVANAEAEACAAPAEVDVVTTVVVVSEAPVPEAVPATTPDAAGESPEEEVEAGTPTPPPMNICDADGDVVKAGTSEAVVLGSPRACSTGAAANE